MPKPLADDPGMRAGLQGQGGLGVAQVSRTGMGPITEMQPGSVKGLRLVVKDIDEARQALIERGADVGEVQDIGGVKYAWFSDPDGNLWGLQQWPSGYQGRG